MALFLYISHPGSVTTSRISINPPGSRSLVPQSRIVPGIIFRGFDIAIIMLHFAQRSPVLTCCLAAKYRSSY